MSTTTMNPFKHFTISCPSMEFMLQQIASQRAALLNAKPQMTVLLDAVREDVDSQFDENQSVWKPLKKFTRDKKAKRGDDPRILHETQSGGLRLRDAYAKAGMVEQDGTLVYSFPESKPYARDHQFGKKDDEEGAGVRSLSRAAAQLDRDFENTRF